tara:strand:+ start:2554 stop:2955 length:402 start_codon:yes stop_codon:yes gene_type:complete
MSYDYFIDSCAWVEYFSGSSRGQELKALIEGSILATSILAVAELADKFTRENKDFTQHLTFIQSRAAIVSITISVALTASKIKLNQRKIHPKFGLSDALQYASAREVKSTFVTTDNDLAEMDAVMVIRKPKAL